ncbi:MULTISPECIES: response regulator transcription factor [Paraburkholderia]|uniref:response regulator transcription factor n=1 Tax=Paraburkholderia TaxID=1822464 RepID=UPI00225B82D5|nr:MULTISPECIES: response regulator transcription factor [Paraburkholderia]MCX4161706.1 response regulator transcription factor [Paraburkholderia megapolitana]MDN7157203.1 response regulator transcription factor [Paraburkholderia sp. CHISQ3]MDQ6494248.1 response regulator transcription factor [Paraburkholderia megapolitana]
MHILLVEDDPAHAEAAMRALRSLEGPVHHVNDGQKAVAFLKTHLADLIIIDWQLPGIDGFELLQWVRVNLGDRPVVLFLTSRVLEVDIVRALRAGADDYIAKPFRLDELTARVEALLRRHQRSIKSADVLCVGNYILDSGHRCISLHGKRIELTGREFDVAAFLLRNTGRVISRDLLAKLAWGREIDSTSRTIDTHIYRIRQKLFADPENGLRLRTIYTHGYRLDEDD